MQITKDHADFIRHADPAGKPIDQLSEDETEIARDLLKNGSVFLGWKGLVASRYFPTAKGRSTAFAFYSSHIDGSGI